MSQVVAVTTVSAAVALTSVQIVAARTTRKGFILYNNSSNSVYVNFDRPATGSSCSIIIASFAAWSWPFPDHYTGTITAIRNAGTGTITVTEFCQ